MQYSDSPPVQPVEVSVNHNAYTDSPDLHPNLILGSLQLLFWLFFHPSAWGSYVARIDPTLNKDFYPAELSQTQWHNPKVWRLMIQTLIICPLLFMTVASVVFWTIYRSSEALLSIVAISMIGGMVGGLFFGLPFGVASSLSIGLSVGIIGGLISGASLDVALSLAAGIVGSVKGFMERCKRTDIIIKQLSSVIVGLLLGIFGISLAVGFAYIVLNRIMGKQFENIVSFDLVEGLIGSVAFGVGCIIVTIMTSAIIRRPKKLYIYHCGEKVNSLYLLYLLVV